jgi:large conductance mechanosensitive channel
MSLLKEFKEFAMRGNVVDMAVGVIIGAAFGKIISSLVDDVMMPPIGYLTGGIDFKDKVAELVAKTATGPGVSIKWGAFTNTVIQFLIVAFCLFIVIKVMNMLMAKKPEAPKSPEPTLTEKLLTEIRDTLKAK